MYFVSQRIPLCRQLLKTWLCISAHHWRVPSITAGERKCARFPHCMLWLAEQVFRVSGFTQALGRSLFTELDFAGVWSSAQPRLGGGDCTGACHRGVRYAKPLPTSQQESFGSLCQPNSGEFSQDVFLGYC